MNCTQLTAAAALGLLVFFAGCSATKTTQVEGLDGRTGLTAGALAEPVEFVQRLRTAPRR